MNQKVLKEKEDTVADLHHKLKTATTSVLTDYRGLNVAEVTQLRTQLREAGIQYKVVKNTLTKLAADQAGIAGLDEFLSGPTAIAFGTTDPVSPAKVLFNFAKTHKNLTIKGGILEGRAIGPEGVKTLADLPSREELLAKVLGGMQAPLRGMAVVLAGPLRSLVIALDAVRAQKEAG